MTDLKVTASHVRALAHKQGVIAANIIAAQTAADGAAPWIALSHGLVCSATSAAVTAASYARDSACQAMHLASDELQTHLEIAAARYDGTDAETKGWLDGTMGS